MRYFFHTVDSLQEQDAYTHKKIEISIIQYKYKYYVVLFTETMLTFSSMQEFLNS